MKRYTIFNMYIRGSNQTPQALHALNNLWKKLFNKSMKSEAEKLFLDWANNSEIEIALQGGNHQELENLYQSLKNIPTIPCSKFNESEEALNGACTCVSFVANEATIESVNFIRKMKSSMLIDEKMKPLLIQHLKDNGFNVKNEEDLWFVSSYIAVLPLAS